jgi:hypothetical protein
VGAGDVFFVGGVGFVGFGCVVVLGHGGSSILLREMRKGVGGDVRGNGGSGRAGGAGQEENGVWDGCWSGSGWRWWWRGWC